jgi:hypothetical protein
VATRQCPYCGRLLSDLLAQCPYCHEAIPEIRVVSPRRSDEQGKIRQGLLCMLLAAVIHYFAGGYSAMELPFPMEQVVTFYLSPLLFLSGLGLVLYGFHLRRKA